MALTPLETFQAIETEKKKKKHNQAYCREPGLSRYQNKE